MEYSWVPYSGGGAVVLAAILGLITVALVVVAFRFTGTLPGLSAGTGIIVLTVVVWILSIVTFPVAIVAYGLAAKGAGVILPHPPNPVTPVTFTTAAVVFVVVAVFTHARFRTRLGNALLCACAGPMIFELPFDLIVMARTSAIPPFPGVRISRWTVILLAAVFAVFTVWAAIGFTYPLGGLPLALNIASKVLGFLVVLSVFVRRDDFATRPEVRTPQS